MINVASQFERFLGHLIMKFLVTILNWWSNPQGDKLVRRGFLKTRREALPPPRNERQAGR